MDRDKLKIDGRLISTAY